MSSFSDHVSQSLSKRGIKSHSYLSSLTSHLKTSSGGKGQIEALTRQCLVTYSGVYREGNICAGDIEGKSAELLDGEALTITQQGKFNTSPSTELLKKAAWQPAQSLDKKPASTCEPETDTDGLSSFICDVQSSDSECFGCLSPPIMPSQSLISRLQEISLTNQKPQSQPSSHTKPYEASRMRSGPHMSKAADRLPFIDSEAGSPLTFSNFRVSRCDQYSASATSLDCGTYEIGLQRSQLCLALSQDSNNPAKNR